MRARQQQTYELPSEIVRRGWCQHSHAMDAMWQHCSVLDQDAQRWDLLGCIIKARATGTKLPSAVTRVLVETGTTLIHWNDRIGRTQAEVVELLERIGL